MAGLIDLGAALLLDAIAVLHGEVRIVGRDAERVEVGLDRLGRTAELSERVGDADVALDPVGSERCRLHTPNALQIVRKKTCWRFKKKL